ncbi:MAG TPA: RNA polymerase factor sigma-32 [Polyangiaceae bacterium]|nr:RNA polymerase factor sigma-32 [Polyangiaceae bacterium]
MVPLSALQVPLSRPKAKTDSKAAKPRVKAVVETTAEPANEKPSNEEDEEAEEAPDAELDDDAAIEAEVEVEAFDSGDVEAFEETDEDDERSQALAPVTAGVSLNDPLATYMREVQRHPLLTRDEEHQLAMLYHETGDVDAAKRLVTSNLRLVVKIAYEYKRAHKNMMDLVQEGNIGLMQAVKRFDPHRGVKLSSYSAWWIRAYMLRFILNNWRLVKLGTTQAQRKLFFNLNKERARLAALGIEPTHEEIARRLDVAEKDVQQMDLRLSAADSSLDVPVGDNDGRQTTRLDLLPSRSAGPDSLTENAELLSMLQDHLQTFRETLSGKDLEIFNKRMVADEPLTLQELGDQFGVSRERVRQLEARVTGRLRTFLTACLGDAVEADPAA